MAGRKASVVVGNRPDYDNCRVCGKHMDGLPLWEVGDLTVTITECQFCGKSHGMRCPEVKAIEYFEDGKVKRVEFLTAADYQPFQLPMPYSWHHPQPVTWGVSNTHGGTVNG